MKRMLQLFFIVFLLFTQTVFAAGSNILFTNVNIFDGKNEKLALEQDVLIEGNLVSKIGKDLEIGRAHV